MFFSPNFCCLTIGAKHQVRIRKPRVVLIDKNALCKGSTRNLLTNAHIVLGEVLRLWNLEIQVDRSSSSNSGHGSNQYFAFASFSVALQSLTRAGREILNTRILKIDAYRKFFWLKKGCRCFPFGAEEF